MIAPGRLTTVLVLAVAIAVAVSGCTSAPVVSDRSSGYRGSEEVAADSPAEPLVAQSEASGADPLDGNSAFGDSPAGQAPTEQASTTARLRVYTADLELSVVSVQQARQQIMVLVEDAGGYIESSTDEALVVRVPAADFQAILDSIESSGDVIDRSVQTADVTDQYRDLGRRLEIAEASRDRLYALLERAREPDERVSILRDIRRLTEEIEQLRSSRDSLSRLIAFSRITVQLRARLDTNSSVSQRIPFRWIGSLDPLTTTVGAAAERVRVVLPSEFAVFRSGTQLRAESAVGVRVRVGGRTNDPVGDASFWQDALAYHLGPLYRSTERVDLGEFKGVMLESKDPDPHFYLVVVASRRNELIVAEVFFPDSASRRDVSDAVTAAFEDVEL